MKRTSIFMAVLFVVIVGAGFVPSTTTFEQPTRSTLPNFDTQPVPYIEPIEYPLPLPAILATSTTATTSPQTPQNDPQRVFITKVTAYNTVPEQTDSTPCISASGDDICGRDDVVACPTILPLGTMVEIEGNMYECLDRTHPRFDYRFDISFDKDISGALAWGIRTVEVRVI